MSENLVIIIAVTAFFVLAGIAVLAAVISAVASTAADSSDPKE